jgi:hypothetical protein
MSMTVTIRYLLHRHPQKYEAIEAYWMSHKNAYGFIKNFSMFPVLDTTPFTCYGQAVIIVIYMFSVPGVCLLITSLFTYKPLSNHPASVVLGGLFIVMICLLFLIGYRLISNLRKTLIS